MRTASIDRDSELCQATSSERRFASQLGLEHAFTLTELLVVIAIIALLAALLVPALSRANSAFIAGTLHAGSCTSGRRKQLSMIAFAASYMKTLEQHGVLDTGSRQGAGLAEAP